MTGREILNLLDEAQSLLVHVRTLIDEPPAIFDQDVALAEITRATKRLDQIAEVRL